MSLAAPAVVALDEDEVAIQEVRLFELFQEDSDRSVCDTDLFDVLRGHPPMAMSCDVHHAQMHEAEIGLFGGQVLCRDPGYRQVAQGVFKVLSEVGEIEETRCCQVASCSQL